MIVVRLMLLACGVSVRGMLCDACLLLVFCIHAVSCESLVCRRACVLVLRGHMTVNCRRAVFSVLVPERKGKGGLSVSPEATKLPHLGLAIQVSLTLSLEPRVSHARTTSAPILKL